MDMPTSSANPAPKQENPESLWGPAEDKLFKAYEEGIARSAVTERKMRQLVEAAQAIAKELQASMSFFKPKYEELLRMKEKFAAQVLVDLPLSPAHPAKTKARPAPPKTNKTTQKQEKKARAAVEEIQPAFPPKSKTAATIKTTRKPLAPASGKEGQCTYKNPQLIRCENEIAPTKSNKKSLNCLPHRIKADKGSTPEYKKPAYEGHHQWYKTFEKSDAKLGKCYDKEGNPVKKTRDEAVERTREGEQAKKKKKAPPATSTDAKQGLKSKKRPREEAEEHTVEGEMAKKKKKKKKAVPATSSGKR
jgi:hypothetical protein